MRRPPPSVTSKIESVAKIDAGRLYAELRQAAHPSRRRHPAEHTLQTTALVDEAFVKLAQAGTILSRETALRDWRFARAWLKSEMNGSESYQK
jgi:ECF sigma factor